MISLQLTHKAIKGNENPSKGLAQEIGKLQDFNGLQQLNTPTIVHINMPRL